MLKYIYRVVKWFPFCDTLSSKTYILIIMRHLGLRPESYKVTILCFLNKNMKLYINLDSLSVLLLTYWQVHAWALKHKYNV